MTEKWRLVITFKRYGSMYSAFNDKRAAYSAMIEIATCQSRFYILNDCALCVDEIKCMNVEDIPEEDDEEEIDFDLDM